MIDILEERKARREARESNYRKMLIKARKDRGLTMDQVGRTLHYSYATIYKAEHGMIYNKEKSKCARDFFRAAEDFYGIPGEELRKKG